MKSDLLAAGIKNVLPKAIFSEERERGREAEREGERKGESRREMRVEWETRKKTISEF